MQAWQRCVRKSRNGLTQNEREELMHYLKKIADAKTKEDYEDAVEELRDLPLYDEKENVQNAHMRVVAKITLSLQTLLRCVQLL